MYEHWLHQNEAINEVNKYTAERTNDNYCNKNQNEFCHKNSYDENNWKNLLKVSKKDKYIEFRMDFFREELIWIQLNGMK